MWPWGHLAIGYLCYSLLARRRFGRPPGGVETLWLALGTQIPDLVDKPLAWTLGVLPAGRSLGHSLLVALLAVAVVALLARQRGWGRAGLAFGVGYLAHLPVDALVPVLDGEYALLSFLGWPLLSPPPYGEELGFLGQVRTAELTPVLALGLVLSVLAFVRWLADGRPGVAAVRGWIGARRERATES
ncbi:metal-dependent hydrolase [Halobacteriales archaeon QS_4_69_34]|nr:MAG: metal-dependent hydrolase [Halobacteriales archaeon QS_4_69_34]